jgi:hypothetical protein
MAIMVVAVVVVVNTRGLSASFDGVLGVAVVPEVTLDHRCCGPSSALGASLSRER